MSGPSCSRSLSPTSNKKSTNFLKFFFRSSVTDRNVQTYISSEGSITQTAWNGMNKNSNWKVRLKTLENLEDVAKKRRLQVSTLEGIWSETRDMLEIKSLRKAFLSLMCSLTRAQREELGLALRLTFFNTIKNMKMEDVILQWLIALTDDGKNIEPFEYSIGALLVEWLELAFDGANDPNFTMILEMIQLIERLFVHNSTFINEEHLKQIIHCFCKKICENPNFLTVPILLCLEAALKYSHIPKTELPSLVVSLCLLLSNASHRQGSWRLMRILLTSVNAYTVLRMLQAILTNFYHSHSADVPPRARTLIVRGAVFCVAMALWGSQRIDSLRCSPSIIVPALSEAMTLDTIIAREVLLALRRLVGKFGKSLQQLTWTCVVQLLENAVKYIKMNQLSESSDIYAELIQIIALTEKLYFQNEYAGSVDGLFSLIELCSNALPDESIFHLIDYRVSCIDPLSGNWIVQMLFLVQKYIGALNPLRHREKALLVTRSVYHKYRLLYETDVVRKFALVICGGIIGEKDSNFQYQLIMFLFDVAKTVSLRRLNNELFMEVVKLIRKIFNSSVLQFVRSDNLEIMACCFCDLLNERWSALDAELVEMVVGLLIEHLKMHYSLGLNDVVGADVRCRLFELLLLVQMEPSTKQLAKIVILSTNPMQLTRLSNPHLVVGDCLHMDQRLLPNAPLSAEFKWTRICEVTVHALRVEKSWSVLRKIMECLSGVLEFRPLVYSAGEPLVGQLIGALIDLYARYERRQLMVNGEGEKYLCSVLGKLINYTQNIQLCKILVDCTRSGCIQAIMACNLAVQVLPEKMALLNRQLIEHLVQLRPSAQLAIPIIELMNDAADVEKFYEFFQEKQFKSVIDVLVPYSNAKKFNVFIIASVYNVLMRWYVQVPEAMRYEIAQYAIGALSAVNQRNKSANTQIVTADVQPGDLSNSTLPPPRVKSKLSEERMVQQQQQPVINNEEVRNAPGLEDEESALHLTIGSGAGCSSVNNSCAGFGVSSSMESVAGYSSTSSSSVSADSIVTRHHHRHPHHPRGNSGGGGDVAATSAQSGAVSAATPTAVRSQPDGDEALPTMFEVGAFLPPDVPTMDALRQQLRMGGGVSTLSTNDVFQTAMNVASENLNSVGDCHNYPYNHQSRVVASGMSSSSSFMSRPYNDVYQTQIVASTAGRQLSGDGRQLGAEAPFSEQPPLPMFSIGPPVLTPEVSPTIELQMQMQYRLDGHYPSHKGGAMRARDSGSDAMFFRQKSLGSGSNVAQLDGGEMVNRRRSRYLTMNGGGGGNLSVAEFYDIAEEVIEMLRLFMRFWRKREVSSTLAVLKKRRRQGQRRSRAPDGAAEWSYSALLADNVESGTVEKCVEHWIVRHTVVTIRTVCRKDKDVSNDDVLLRARPDCRSSTFSVKRPLNKISAEMKALQSGTNDGGGSSGGIFSSTETITSPLPPSRPPQLPQQQSDVIVVAMADAAASSGRSSLKSRRVLTISPVTIPSAATVSHTSNSSPPTPMASAITAVPMVGGGGSFARAATTQRLLPATSGNLMPSGFRRRNLSNTQSIRRQMPAYLSPNKSHLHQQNGLNFGATGAAAGGGADFGGGTAADIANSADDDKTAVNMEYVQYIVRHVFGKESWVMRSFDHIPNDFNSGVSCIGNADPAASLLLNLCGADTASGDGGEAPTDGTRKDLTNAVAAASAVLKIPPKENEFMQRTLRLLDKIDAQEFHVVGLLYIGEEQSHQESEILANQYGSDRYMKFIRLLGDVVSLDDDPGGLQRGKHGTFTYEYVDALSRIVFLVATFMPNSDDDPKCNAKKSLIGNNFVSIVFNESGKPYRLGTVSGKFDRVALELVPHDDDTVVVTLHARREIACWLAMTRTFLSDEDAARVVRKIAVRAQLSVNVWRSLEECPQNDNVRPYISQCVDRLRKIRGLKQKGIPEL